MYEMAKKAREAMRGKAKRLAGEKDQKTDSSDWSPAEPLNADVKTGMRPVSQRQFKKGGKVEGKASVKHAGRKARKAGGRLVADKELREEKSEAKQYAIAKMNRNQKEANQERPGIKHVGGMKSGGRAKKQVGGGMGVPMPQPLPEEVRAQRALARQLSNPEGMDVNAAQAQMMNQQMLDNARQQAMENAYENERRGAMMRKSGGRAKKAFGGMPMPQDVAKNVIAGMMSGKGEVARKKGGKVNYEPSCDLPEEKAVTSTKGQEAIEKAAAKRSEPKRAKAQHYADGGMPNQPDPRMGIVNKQFLNFGSGASGSPYKKGGKAKHPDEAMDKALIKKMVKPSARTNKKEGGFLRTLGDRVAGDLVADEAMKLKDKILGEEGLGSMFKRGGKAAKKRSGKNEGGMTADEMDTHKKATEATEGHLPQYQQDAYERESNRYGKWKKEHGITALKKGGAAKRPGKFYGGAMGPGTAPQITPPAAQSGMPPLPQLGRKAGGRTKGKGKTNINIVIAAGKPMPGMDQQMPPGGMPGLPGGGAPAGVPVPVGAGAPPAAAPMPMPVPMPMPMPAAGGAPMARKAGGRISKVASSYKDMTAGAGSGEGRLQKTDIAKRGERKAGGKVYRSYKDMDAGAGSGVGRLEKTEIQKRK